MNKISVIIPTYNRPTELKNAVESVLSQSISPMEVLVVNDGEFHEGIKDLERHELVTVLQNSKPMGGNYSRNRGADEASGDILMFLDDDDTWNKDKIKNQLAVFEQSETIGLVYSNRNVVNEEGKLMRRITSDKAGNLYPDILFSNIIGTTSTVAIKKAIFDEAGKFDLGLTALQDYDLWIRICKISQIGLDKEFSVNYTVAGNFKGQVSGSGEKKKAAVDYLLNKYKHEIADLRGGQNKVKSNLYFYIAKSYKNTSYTKAAFYGMKSFLGGGSIKALAFLLPNALMKLMRK